ncbi:MAG: RHS repeat protein, partial [Betaproteobacteria bacterium]|nr:RHS repeat protein [Betaproteobacteria bacterium]
MAATHHPTPPARTTRHLIRHRACLAAWLGCGLFISFAATAITQTRTSAFEYDPVTGLVSKEIIEPDSPDSCLVSSYTYDSVGNRTSITTRNCNGSSSEAPAPTGAALFSSRTSRSLYDTRGQFTITSYNALNHPISRTYDPRFGAVQSTTDANQLTTTWQLDALGRKTLETRPDGTTTQWVYELCNSIAGGTATCPTYGVMLVTTITPGSPIVKTYSNSLGREIRVESQGADGTWIRTDTQYDSLGRIAQVSQPYYINASPVWTIYTYDVLDRVISEAAPATAAGTRTVTTTYS